MTKLTRRTVVLSATATAALGLSGPLEFLPSAWAGNAREKGHVKYSIGDIQCTAIYDGIWQKSHDESFIPTASLDEVKAALAKSGHTEDYVPIEFAQTVVKTGGKTVMIDAGTGGQLAPTAGLGGKNLAAAGIDAASIDTILISHFHPDHIFGLMAKDTNEQIYPNAEIIVPEAEYKFWTDPGIIEKLPERRRGLAKRIQATFPNWKNVRRVATGSEVAPGIRSEAAHGHTPGHTAFQITSGDNELLVVGDIAVVPALFVANPTWQLAFDADKQAAIDTRVKYFQRAVADKAVMSGYHFGFPNAGKILKDGNGFVFEPAGA